jgi:hypothetical protein
MIKKILGFLRIGAFSLGVLLVAGATVAQQAPSLTAPTWSEGDWWVVECQLYHTGKVVPGAATAGWTARQSWKFRVESVTSLADQPHYVVTVHPRSDNACPYWFRYWFRATDRRVSRTELHHPEPSADKTRSIGPPAVVTDYSDQEPAPFLSGEFPALPMTVPLFDADPRPRVFGSQPGPPGIVQEVNEAARSALVQNADPRLKSILEVSPPENSRLVSIRSDIDGVERQYWLIDLPWCAYGERDGSQQMQRRYWLVDMGKD